MFKVLNEILLETVTFWHLNLPSFVGLELGEFHLCSDPSPSSRQRGRIGSHKGQDILWCSRQYSEGE